MTNWSNRMATAISARQGNANSANSASRSAPEAIGTIGANGINVVNAKAVESEPIGTNGTIGNDVFSPEMATSGELLALSAITAQGVIATPRHPVDPVDIVERAAIIAEGDHCNRAEADRRALDQSGFAAWGTLADAHAAAIHTALDRLPEPTTDAGRRLLSVTRAFLDTDHWYRAVEQGWSTIELFGVNPHAPLDCVDGQGLVAGLALSRLNGGRLQAIKEDRATIRYRSGSLLTQRRGAAGLITAELWWECPALIGEAAT